MSEEDTGTTDPATDDSTNPEKDDAPPDPTEGQEEGDPPGADQLGDAGKKALDAMKARWQTERKARQAAEKALTANKPKAEGDAPDPEKIRAEAKAEAAAEVLRERALDKAVAKASGRLSNPEDARAFLAGHVEDFIDGTKLDQDAIGDAIDELIKERPYLTAQGGRKFKGSGDGGARKGSGATTQLTEQDLQKMSPYAIEKARLEGRFKDLLGG